MKKIDKKEKAIVIIGSGAGGGSILKKHQIEELSLYLKHIATDKTNWN